MAEAKTTPTFGEKMSAQICGQSNYAARVILHISSTDLAKALDEAYQAGRQATITPELVFGAVNHG